MEEEIETKEIQCQSGNIKYITNLKRVINVDKMSFKYDEKNDIIKNVYEGGFKLWECTLDLIQYLEKQKQQNVNYIQGKNVIDIGCGHGLLGIYALQEKANFVTFQDFNKEVLDMVTQKNIEINFNQNVLQSQSVFLSGDWNNVNNKIEQQINEMSGQQQIVKQYPKKYDLIMMSEVIYNTDNYKKVTDLVIQILQPGTGICLMANKLFYFGCGGSMPEYTEFLEKNYSDVLQWETAEFINNKKGNKREIFALRLK